MNYNTALSNIGLDISHKKKKHINCLELMGCGGLSKSSRQTPNAKLENRNQKKRDIHIISRAEKSLLFKSSKGHKASKFATLKHININTIFCKEETFETSICH